MTKYVSTMTDQEIEAWMRAPGAAAARAATAGNGKSLLEEIESRPRNSRPAPPKRKRKPATGGPMRPGPSVLEEPHPGLVLPPPPCRFCGEPSVVENRCARHDALWQRLSGKQATDLEAIADRGI